MKDNKVGIFEFTLCMFLKGICLPNKLLWLYSKLLVLLKQYVKSATYCVLAFIHLSVFTNGSENSGCRQF